ncbi:hypothetical protein HNP40_002630 [Mycobacteroides chelonae]|nr:hypothetical protein [Mycobacteroides chelonae]
MVDSADGSIVGLACEPLVTGVTTGVLADLVNPLKGQENAPDGVFLQGLGTDVSDLTDPLGEAIALPVNSPDQPELALARGAALASAQEPDFEASTALLGQAYSLEGPRVRALRTPTLSRKAPASSGKSRPSCVNSMTSRIHQQERMPFLLVGAPLLLVFGICSVALAVSLTVSVCSTVDQGPSSPDRAVVQNPLPPEAPQQLAPAPLAEAPAPAARAPAAGRPCARGACAGSATASRRTGADPVVPPGAGAATAPGQPVVGASA